jgi:hypothetical protein
MYSQRLFGNPLWTINTVVRWIAFRDRNSLVPRNVDEDSWPLRHDDLESMRELQSEARLFRALPDGKLEAREKDRLIPKGYWAERAPTAGGLSSTSRSQHLERENVLRIFPDNEDVLGILPQEVTRPRADARTDRQVKIGRPSQIQHYFKEFEPTLASRSLSKTLSKEANIL